MAVPRLPDGVADDRWTGPARPTGLASGGLVAPPEWFRPHPARVNDYWLGGTDNFACDRLAADEVARSVPGAVAAARACREHLRSSVWWLTAAGQRQFLDLGSGLPVAGAVHEVARSITRTARVVYARHDAVALTHARALVGPVPGVTVLDTAPEAALDGVRAGALLDLDRPVVGLVSTVPDLPDLTELTYLPGVPERLLRGFREALAPGSYVVLSIAPAHVPAAGAGALTDGYEVVEEVRRPVSADGPVDVLVGVVRVPHPVRGRPR